MRYGPVEGIVPFWIADGVPLGTGAANVSARIVRKSPRGEVSEILIVRLALFTWIPEMSPLSVAPNLAAPRIVL